MASNSFILCHDCKAHIDLSIDHPIQCIRCGHSFRDYYQCRECNNYTEIIPCESCGYYECPECNNRTKSIPCEFCGYDPDTEQLTHKCKTCGELIRKDSSACKNCLDWQRGLKNITDSIVPFSDLHKKGLIRKEQFEVKVMDIVVSGVSNQISINEMKDYLSIFKKMLDDDHIDEDIYGKISDLLLKKCEISKKSQDSLSKKKEKPLRLGETDRYLQSKKIEKPPDTHHHAKKDVPSKDPTKKDTMSIGAKIIWSIVVVFVGSVIMGLIKEFLGFGILHGLALIGTCWGLYHIWSK